MRVSDASADVEKYCENTERAGEGATGCWGALFQGRETLFGETPGQRQERQVGTHLVGFQVGQCDQQRCKE